LDKEELMRETAIQAAFEASKIIKSNLGKIQSNEVDLKQKFDFVTHVDRESEAKIIKVIKSRFPEHKIFAEESTKDEHGGYRWIIDPLDGTTNFIHAFPVFAISIALELEGEIILGVVLDPLRDELFVAQKGKGASLNGKPIHVSHTGDLAVSLLTTGFPFRNKESLDLYLESFRKLFLQVSGIRRIGCVALDFCYLASGRCEGFWEIGLSPWDVAAGYLIIKEAGGMITDFSGGDEAVWTGNVVASNGLIHEHILKVASEVFAGRINK